MKTILKRFATKAVIGLILWQVIFYFVINQHTNFNGWLTDKVVSSTIIGLRTFGYNATKGTFLNESSEERRTVFIDNQPVVLVADPCNGLELMALFAGFILCFPGPIIYKSLFIPIGCLITFSINVVREIVLALNYKYFQDTFEFNHHYTYVLIVYSLIFLMWRFWLNNYSSVAIKFNKSGQKSV